MSDGRMYLNEDAFNLLLHKIGYFAEQSGRLSLALERARNEMQVDECNTRALRERLRTYADRIDEWVTYWQTARAGLCRRCEKALPPGPAPINTDIPF